ncbi:UNVERIFIED_CONTAM: hypothetical protein GTU68_015665 [Idotea baltica]|nr:hypothetical protein [Idotea baltica]
MRNYEVTFIIDPVLSAQDIKNTAKVYVDHLENEGCKITHVNDMGLKPLAYPINRRNTGMYHCVEFQSENGSFIAKMELALRRDERIMRFLTVSLDKFGVKYNDDKRNGVISSYVKKVKEEPKENDRRSRGSKPAPKPAAKAPVVTEKPAVAEKPVTSTDNNEEE